MTYDHESKSSYSVTVKADDNNGGTATIDVTITIADVLDVSQQAISRSLQRTDPDDPEVRRIAALLGWIKLTTNDAYKSARARERADTFYDNRLFRCCFS